MRACLKTRRFSAFWSQYIMHGIKYNISSDFTCFHKSKLQKYSDICAFFLYRCVQKANQRGCRVRHVLCVRGAYRVVQTLYVDDAFNSRTPCVQARLVQVTPRNELAQHGHSFYNALKSYVTLGKLAKMYPLNLYRPILKCHISNSYTPRIIRTCSNKSERDLIKYANAERMLYLLLEKLDKSMHSRWMLMLAQYTRPCRARALGASTFQHECIDLSSLNK